MINSILNYTYKCVLLLPLHSPNLEVFSSSGSVNTKLLSTPIVNSFNMQLPRGTFLSLQKATTLSKFLTELKETGYSGHCKFLLDSKEVSLILDGGIPVLADFPPLAGKAAIEKVRKNGSKTIDAELYSLSRTQIQRSFEFNRHFRTGEKAGSGTAGNDQPDKGASDEKNQGEVRDATPAPIPPEEQQPEEIQLPRGTFLEERAGVSLSDLLDDLKSKRFFGYCIFLVDDKLATIVMENGISLLADYAPKRGSSVLQVLQTKVNHPVDAELYSLTPTQMKLALEFNREYRVSVTSKPRLIHIKPQKSPERPLKKRMRERKRNIDSEDFDEQMNEIEKMNFDEMTGNFRENIKDIVERLDLGHLIQDEAEPEQAGDIKKEVKNSDRR